MSCGNDFYGAKERVLAFSDAQAAPAVDEDTVVMLMERNQVADADGRAPGTPGYISTYSVELTVADLFDLKAVKAAGVQTISFTSEGSTVSRSAVDPAAFRALAAQWRAKALPGGGSGLTVIDLRGDGGSARVPRSAYLGETPDTPRWWNDVD